MPLHGPEENNLLPSQTINSDHSEESLTGATTTLSLLSPHKNNSICMNLSKDLDRHKCYFHCKQNCFLDYFKDLLLASAVIYMGIVSFQYNKLEDTYTEFIGNPTGILSVATNRSHEFLLCHKGNATYIPNSPNHFSK